MAKFNEADTARLKKAKEARARGTSIEGAVAIALTNVPLGDHRQYLKAEFIRTLRTWKIPDASRPMQNEVPVTDGWTTGLIQAARAFENNILEDVPEHDR